MPSEVTPTMRRRQLGIELRRLREAGGRTIDEVARHIGRAQSTVSRIETGKSGARPAHVRMMLDLYGVPEGERRQALLDLAREGRRRGLWSQWGDVTSPDFMRFLGYEGSAEEVRAYENRAVVGVLQTPEYARALLCADPAVDAAEVDRRVELRMARQACLTGPEPLSLCVVLDESVLVRRIGGPEVLRRQLLHLLEVGRLEHVALHVLPFERGAHAGIDGPFTIIRFQGSGDPDVVSVEGPAGLVYLERARDLRRQTGAFSRLVSESLTREGSAALVECRAAELTG